MSSLSASISYIKESKWKQTVFTFSEWCIVQYIFENDQQDAHFISCFFQLYYPVHVSNKHVHHAEVTSVHAAFSIFMLKLY